MKYLALLRTLIGRPEVMTLVATAAVSWGLPYLMAQAAQARTELAQADELIPQQQQTLANLAKSITAGRNQLYEIGRRIAEQRTQAAAAPTPVDVDAATPVDESVDVAP